MEVVVTIPDAFASQFQQDTGEISRQMLESFAIEAYRREELSLGQVAEFLALSIDEANGLLKEHGVPSSYTMEDLRMDRASLDLLLSR